MDDITRTLAGDPHPNSPPAMLRRWGPFEIRRLVGQGGFGEVYRAFDTTLQREVALKLLKPSALGQDDESKRVLREARLLARVRHPNVVPVHGVDSFDGRVGFWSDFVEGKTLSALLAIQGPFGPHETISIGIDLARAVGAVHAAGLLHRDIKTGNSMREVGGRILLMDFGLSHGRDDEDSSFGGTPPYMAPELLAGEPATVATDIFALGILLYHLLTGKYPSTGTSFNEVQQSHTDTGSRKHLLDERPDVPAPLARVVETASHRDPGQRYRSAGELISALSEAMGAGGLVTGGGPSIPAQPSRPVRAGLPLWMLVPLAALIAIAFYLAATRAGARLGPLSAGGAHASYLKAQDYLDHYYRPRGVEDALEWFQKTVAQDPKFALAYAGLARAHFLQYWQLGEPKFIEPTLANATKALELDRNLASVHVTLGRLYTETGKNDLASQELNEALRLDANNAEAHHGLAELYMKQGRTADVEPALQRAIDLAPNDWRFPDAMAYVHTTAGRLETALEWNRIAVARSPGNPRALNNLGSAYNRLGRFAEARETLEKAIRIEPGFNRYSNLGNVLLAQRQYEEAAKVYRRALELNESGYLAWGNLGIALSRLPGRAAEAKEAFLRGIEFGERLRGKNPNDGVLLSILGMYHACVQDGTKSDALLRQAIAVLPRDPEVHFRAALAHEAFRRRTEAIRSADQALARGLPPATFDRWPELDGLRSDPRFLQLARKHAKKP